MRRATFVWIAGSAFVLAVAATGLIAAHGGDANAVHSCVTLAGTLRVVGPNDVCRTNESPLDWSIQGPTGAQGLTGPQGPTGAQGPTGPSDAFFQSSGLLAGTNVGRTRTQVAHLSLPAGKYALHANATVHNQGLASSTVAFGCDISGPQGELERGTGRLGPAGGVADRAVIGITGVIQSTSPLEVTLGCLANPVGMNPSDVIAFHIQFLAIRVGEVTVEPLP